MPSAVADVRSPRVAVLDDDSANRDLVETLLRACGATIVVATDDGFEILDFLRAEEVSAVFCDLEMPVMHGMEFIERLAFDSPQTPLVLMSGSNEPALRAGAELARRQGLMLLAALRKPLSLSDVQGIMQVLAGKTGG